MITNPGVVVGWLGLCLISMYVYMRILNIKPTSSKIAVAVIFAVTVSLLLQNHPPLFELWFVGSVFVFMSLITRVKANIRVAAVIIAIGMSLGSEIFANTVMLFIHALVEYLYWVAVAAREGIPLGQMGDISPLFGIHPDNNPIFVIPLAVWEFFVALISAAFMFSLFKLKRLKTGFAFMENKTARLIGVALSIIMMVAKSSWRFLSGLFDLHSFSAADLPAFGIFVLIAINGCTLAIYFWWKSRTTELYLNRVEKKSVQSEIAEKNRQIKTLTDSNEALSAIIHKDNKSLPAMYTAVADFLSTSEEGQRLLNEISDTIKERNNLPIASPDRKPMTNIPRFDNILNYMKLRAEAQGIQFEFAPCGQITAKPGIETLLADLIENAIIAVTHSTNKKISVTMGEVSGHLQIVIRDSGVNFKDETLTALGTKKTTTYANTGGSGIGYITIFEILNEAKASLTISEQVQEAPFTKAITVCFDEQSEFVVLRG
ncbi:MAG: GHKL domain-containing protein [Defluviitaleaceae bacterium]|nr:GHKL domain-containing protein [Defluviitaleaceae bacterium]